MELKIRKVDHALSSKGFIRDLSGDHVQLRYFLDDERTRFATKYSHGAKAISDHLIGLMAKQLKLTKEQFIGLVTCHISREDIRSIYMSQMGKTS